MRKKLMKLTSKSTVVCSQIFNEKLVADLSKTLMYNFHYNYIKNSEHPENSPYFDKSNKKVIGKFKDEIPGIPINELIGLRSKMYYSYLKDTDECGKKAKGIKKNVIKKDIKHENYKDVLFNNYKSIP